MFITFPKDHTGSILVDLDVDNEFNNMFFEWCCLNEWKFSNVELDGIWMHHATANDETHFILFKMRWQ